ncbi:MAG TPA: hypothetical protein VN711_00215 [Candidatus Saccharimonadales bacterium]|nr:hypothetical protein [Candidatus Saccharimonadales bacterium]
MKRAEISIVREVTKNAAKVGTVAIGLVGIAWDGLKTMNAGSYHDLTLHGIWNNTGHVLEMVGNHVVRNGPVETPPSVPEAALQLAGGALLLYGAILLGVGAYRGIRNRITHVA